MLTHTLLPSGHSRNSSDSIPSESPPPLPSQTLNPGQSTEVICKPFLRWRTGQTENNSFERATRPCLLLQSRTQRALCFGDCVWTPTENIPVASLCHPSPPFSTAPASGVCLELILPKMYVYQGSGKEEEREGRKPQVLSPIPWLSYPWDLLRNVPHFNVC